MKIKVIPEDFVVEEMVDLPLAKNGPYTVLKLQKRFWNTLDAIDFVARKLGVSKNRFSRAGLKDRYSLSTQYLSFRGAIREKIIEKNFSLTPIGNSGLPVTPNLLRGNNFTVTLRSLDMEEIGIIERNLGEVIDSGIPNFFDDQRFGSARHKQGFFAKKLMHGHLNGALKIHLAYSSAENGRATREFKTNCAMNWGNWRVCQDAVPREFVKTMRFLAEYPRNLKGAIKTIDRDILNLFLLAYQSYIFNETLNLIVSESCGDLKESRYSMGKFVFYRRLKNLERDKEIIIPVVNEKTELIGRVGTKIKQVLDAENITLKDFALRKMRFRGVRFKSFFRRAIIVPEDCSCGEPLTDDIYKGKRKIELKFTLPSGSYATILIKRLTIRI